MGGEPGTSTPAVMCLRCGYDLRTVDAAGVCPECGLAAAASAGVRERLEECPPAWVRRVAIGAGVLAVSAVLLAVPAGEGMLLSAPIGGSPWGRGSGTMMFRDIARWSFWDFLKMGGWVLVLYAAGMLVQGVGVWLVTGREPGGVRTRAGWVRAWRVLTLLAIVGLEFDLLFGAPVTPWKWTWREWWLATGSIVGQVAYLACPAIGLWHLRWLTVRMGQPKLAEHAGIVEAGLSGIQLVFVARSLMWMLRYVAYHHPEAEAWWAYRNATEVLVLGPAVGVGVVYAIRRAQARGAGYAWVAGMWVAGTAWAAEMESRNYTRRLWETVLAVGVPVAAGVTFYLWAVAVLGRTAWTLWGAAREAEEAWRRVDAAR